jgi:hypothetical protein
MNIRENQIISFKDYYGEQRVGIVRGNGPRALGWYIYANNHWFLINENNIRNATDKEKFLYFMEN